MTEDEARKKWCPMVRIPWEYGRDDPKTVVVHNRDSDGYISKNRAYRCIASDCMMWRVRDVRHSTDDQGYCGLAPVEIIK